MTVIAALAVAFMGTSQVPVTVPAQPGGCQTRACEKRVAKKREVHKRYPWCNTWKCVARNDRRAKHREEERWRATTAPYRGWLTSVRMCESGGNYGTNTGNGFYGAYQFTLSTWNSVGGYGYPHLARPLEQDYRAVLTLRSQGRGAWPVCG